MLLSKQQIDNADDRKYEDVAVPEWGGSVRIAEMSGAARDSYEASLITISNGETKQDLSNIRAKLVSACLVDEDFKPIYSADELGNKSGKVLDKLFAIADRINAVTQDQVDTAAKN